MVSGGFGVAVEGCAHPATAQFDGPQTVGDTIDIGHHHGPEVGGGAADQLLQGLPARPVAVGGIDRHHIGPGAPNRLNLRPAWRDVNGTIAIGPLPETHNQGVRAAAAHGANVLRALKPHARGPIAQARLGHGRNHLRIPHGRAFRCLHRDNQARSQQRRRGRRVTHVQPAKGRSSERSGNQARRAANEAGAGAGESGTPGKA